MIDHCPVSMHTFVKLTFSFTDIQQSTERALQSIDNIQRFTSEIIKSSCGIGLFVKLLVICYLLLRFCRFCSL